MARKFILEIIDSDLKNIRGSEEKKIKSTTKKETEKLSETEKNSLIKTIDKLKNKKYKSKSILI